ncbi:hypothetical protein E1178_21005 [Roseibium hamelinense]|nr:hypothetical protein [Roseibium hamelinense]MTI46086.1 hypothetical protein [Roseibium hamelinense]
MSKATDRDLHEAVSEELERDSLKRMIYFTKREAEKDGRAFCAYFLDMALSALEEDSEEMNQLLKAKVTRLPIPGEKEYVANQP